jgi:fumarate reductase subunit C
MQETAMTTRNEVLLWGAQRVSAMVLALCVLVHLLTMIYAVRNGLSAAEILGRTRGNLPLAFFYGIFVASVSVHAPIGVRTILIETLGWQGRLLNVVTGLLALVLAGAGLRAVYAVFA